LKNFLAALLGFRLRWALAIGIVAMLPDLDIFFYTHWSIDHSILPPIAVSVVRVASIDWLRTTSNR